MSLASQTPWTELLSHRFDDVGNEFGPNSHEIVCAFEALDEIESMRRFDRALLEAWGRR